MARNHTVLFVEGDTDAEFYAALIKYYRVNFKISTTVQIVNLRGIGRYENKLYSKLKNQIIPEYKNCSIKVVCCYDTDVFDLAMKPPISWEKVSKNIKSLNADTFVQIKAIRMIEDWFLKDVKGLCGFLNIKIPAKIEGKSAFEKLKKLFKKGNKIYQKGANSHKFVQKLDIKLIRDSIKNEILDLEKTLGLKPLKK